MPLSSYALEMFGSQEISKLTACSPTSIATEFPERSTWLNQFVLRRIFHNHVPDERAALAFAILRRAESAVDEWELACDAVGRGVRTVSGYFKALRHFESCVAALWQGVNFGREALGTSVFQKGDGSSYERLNYIYNKSRHFDPDGLPSGDLHPVWIANGGLSTREQSITFDELREIVGRVARIANTIATGSGTNLTRTTAESRDDTTDEPLED
jgi:hypothetical protein